MKNNYKCTKCNNIFNDLKKKSLHSNTILFLSIQVIGSLADPQAPPSLRGKYDPQSPRNLDDSFPQIKCYVNIDIHDYLIPFNSQNLGNRTLCLSLYEELDLSMEKPPNLDTNNLILCSMFYCFSMTNKQTNTIFILDMLTHKENLEIVILRIIK